jgi:tetratricopeptide (TPR) repeat protein
MNIRFAAQCTLFLLLISLSVTAQISEQEKKQKELEHQQELKRQTRALLDEIAAGSASLKLPENRSFILGRAADLLWEQDEKRARSMFWEALNNLNLMTDPGDAAKVPVGDKSQSQNAYFEMFEARRGLLRLVASRDPQLALDMLHATRQPLLEQKKGNLRFPGERDLEMQIASEAAARDPERAFQMARDSLAKGLSFELFSLVYRLNEQDSELATKFAGEIIDKLKTENIATDLYGWNLAIGLLETSRTPKQVAENAQAPAPLRMRPLKLEEDLRRGLVEMLANAALGVSPKIDLNSLSEVMPEIEEFAPERVAVLRRKLGEVNRSLNKEQQDWNEYNSLVLNGSAEDMLKAAAKASDEPREALYQQAIIAAAMGGRDDSVREFINTQIEDESRRKRLIDSLDSEMIEREAYRGRLEELRKLLPLVRLKEQRASALAYIAIMLEKKGEHDEALTLLNEAQGLVKTDLTSETQSNGLLLLVLAYAQVEPAKAFVIIERTIDRANDEITKALLVARLLKQSGFVKKGEISLNQSGLVPIDFALFRYGKGVMALANADFNRTKAAADRLQRNELRLMARLLIAQSLLKRDGANPP